jgi:solute carrier family 25 (mitochondrial folate transporter), member 32
MRNKNHDAVSPPSPPPSPAPAATRSAQRHAIASQVAGFTSTIAFYPLDVVKMRFMSQDGTTTRQHNNTTYTSLLRSTQTILREEGVRALYRGAHVAVGGSVAAWGVYMYLYRSLLHVLERMEGGGMQGAFHAKVMASVVASSASALASNPIWLIKTRMQLEERHKHSGVPGEYSGFWRSASVVIRNSGLRGLWVGSSAQILLGVPNALNFPIYESIKGLRMRQTGKTSLDLTEVCLCTTITKTILAMLSHPLFLVKTRLQDQRSHQGAVQYTSLPQALRLILQREGALGLYRGVIPALAQAIPRSITQFVVYESCLSLL